MVTLELNKMPITETPTIMLNPGLPPGQYLVQLVVENDKGILSTPVVATVTVRRS